MTRRLLAVGILGLCAACGAPASTTAPRAALRPVALNPDPGPLHTMTSPPRLKLPQLPPLPNDLRPAPKPPNPCILSITVPDTTLGFTFDSAAISPHGRSELSTFAASVVTSNHGLSLTSVTVYGYTSTDAPGQEAHDQKLSENRATATADVLMKVPELKSIPITPTGKGEANPIARNDRSDTERSKNRRSVIAFTFRCPT